MWRIGERGRKTNNRKSYSPVSSNLINFLHLANLRFVNTTGSILYDNCNILPTEFLEHNRRKIIRNYGFMLSILPQDKYCNPSCYNSTKTLFNPKYQEWNLTELLCFGKPSGWFNYFWCKNPPKILSLAGDFVPKWYNEKEALKELKKINWKHCEIAIDDQPVLALQDYHFTSEPITIKSKTIKKIIENHKINNTL